LLDSNEWSTLPVRLRDANAAESVLHGEKEAVWDLLNFLYRQHHPNIKSDGNDSSDTDIVPSEVDTIPSGSDGGNIPVKESPKPKRRPFSATRKPSKEHSFLEHSAVMEELLLRREILGTPRSVTQPRVPPLGFSATGTGTGTGKADNEIEIISKVAIVADNQIETEIATNSKSSNSCSSNSNSNDNSTTSSSSSRSGSTSVSSKKLSSPLLGLKDRILANKKSEEEKYIPLNSTEASFSASDLSESTRNSTNNFNLLDSDGHIEENKTMKIFEIRKAYGRTLSRPWTSIPKRLKISPVSSPMGGRGRTGLLARGGASPVSSSKWSRTGPSPVSSPKWSRTGPSPVSSPKGGRTGPSPVSSAKWSRTGPSPVSSPKGGRTGPSPVSSPKGGGTGPSPVSSPKGGRTGPLGKGSTSLVRSPAGLGGIHDVDSALNDRDSLDGNEGVHMLTRRNGNGADREAIQRDRERDREDTDRGRERDEERKREGEDSIGVCVDSNISYSRNIEISDHRICGDVVSDGYNHDNYDDDDDDELLYDDRSFVKNDGGGSGGGGGDGDKNESDVEGEEEVGEGGVEGEGEGDSDGEGDSEGEGELEGEGGEGEGEGGEGEGEGGEGEGGEGEGEGEGEGISTLSDNVSCTDSVPTSDNITEYSNLDQYRVRRHGRDVRGSTYNQNILNRNKNNNIINKNNIENTDSNHNTNHDENKNNNDNNNNNNNNTHSPTRTNNQQKQFQKPKTVEKAEKQKFTDLVALNPGPTFLRHVDCVTGGSHERAGLAPSDSNDSRTLSTKWPSDSVPISTGNSQNNSDIPRNIPNNVSGNVPGNIGRNDSNDVPRNTGENVLQNNRKRNPEKRINRTFSKDLRNILLNNNANTVECSSNVSGAIGTEVNSETDLKNTDSVSRISNKSNSTPALIPQGSLGGEKEKGREKDKVEVKKQNSMGEQRKDGREDGRKGVKEGEKGGDVSEIEKEKENVFSWLCGLGVQAAKVGTPPSDFNTYDTPGFRGQNPNLAGDIPGAPVESVVQDLSNEWHNGVLLCELCAVLRPLQKDENKRVVTYDRRGHKVSSRLVLTGSETSVRSKAQVTVTMTVTCSGFAVKFFYFYFRLCFTLLFLFFLFFSLVFYWFCNDDYRCVYVYFITVTVTISNLVRVLILILTLFITPLLSFFSPPFLSSSSSPPLALLLFHTSSYLFPFSLPFSCSFTPFLLHPPLGTSQPPARFEQSTAHQRPREHS
jgi:hypothetical protein